MSERPQSQMAEDYHFSVIRRALEEIDAAPIPLGLEELARRMDMSSAHFQRVFTRWAGVSPKRYQQYLSLDHAKSLLRDRFTVLETSEALGLSGTGRLHDLLIRWEAMSPGDYASGGAGLAISWGWFDTPFGEALAMGTTRGLCGLGFAAEAGREQTYLDLSGRWPRADFHENREAIAPWVEAALGVKGETRLALLGPPLQIKVWEALLQVPEGHVTTYSQIAQSIAAPRAVRAVATAVGRNPIAWLIPCHRAIRKSGALGGYHWGLPVKRAMIAWESARIDSLQSP